MLITTQVSPTTCDFVMSASPSDPPLIISTLQHIMKQRGLAHTTAMFSHSSVKQPIPDAVRMQFQNFSKCSKGVGRAPIILTIVWKEGKYLSYLSCNLSIDQHFLLSKIVSKTKIFSYVLFWSKAKVC